MIDEDHSYMKTRGGWWKDVEIKCEQSNCSCKCAESALFFCYSQQFFGT